MTCRQALEQVRTAIYNRITRTCPYITDDGILCVVNKALSESEADVELALEKPRRNCDKYSLEEAQRIYRTDAPVDKDGVIIPSFEEWLYMEVKS